LPSSAPASASPTEAARDIYDRICKEWLPNWEPEFSDLFHLAAVGYVRDQGLGDLMTRVDQALAQAQAKGPNSWHAVEDPSNKLSMPAEQWRTLLTEAVSGGRLSLAFFPVVQGRPDPCRCTRKA
jgi:hypothetical protein